MQGANYRDAILVAVAAALPGAVLVVALRWLSGPLPGADVVFGALGWPILIALPLTAAGCTFAVAARLLGGRMHGLRQMRDSEALLAQAEVLAATGSWLADLRAGTCGWSRNALNLFDIDPHRSPSVLPQTRLRAVHPEDRDRVRIAFERLAAQGGSYSIEFRIVLPRQRVRWLRELAIRCDGGRGAPSRILGVVQDITDTRLQRELLRENDHRFRMLFDHTPTIAVQGYDCRRRVIFWNRASESLYGYRAEQTMGRRLEELIIPAEQRGAVADAVQRWLEDGIAISPGERDLVRSDGRPVTVFANHVLLTNARGEPEFYRIDVDLTDRRRADDALREAAALFEHTHEAVVITDADHIIRAVNPAFTAITGYGSAEAVGRRARLLVSPRQDDAFYEELWRNVRDSGHWQGEIWNRRRNGEVYPQWATITRVPDAQGAPWRLLCVFTDISRLKCSEARLEQLAHYDALTGLPNRLLVQARLNHGLARARRRRQLLAVLFLDLDRFKTVNDSLGHAAGDELLAAIAARLGSRLRQSDTLARLGGDEFLVLLEDLDRPGAAANVAEALIVALEEPFTITGAREVYVGASVGISLFPDHGATSGELIRNADSAMYLAKSGGRNTFRFYTEALTRAARQRLETEAALRRALDRGEFVLHYQPQVSMADGRVIGVEALLRWNRPGQGLVSPEDFIDLAEDTGLMLPVAEWVLGTAVRQLRAWDDAGMPPLRMAVNLSCRQLGWPELVDRVRSALAAADLAPDRLELEITETAIMQLGATAEAILNAIKGLGVRLSIDDFGTGYSSLARLKNLPVDRLKIDRGFVRDIPHDASDREIATTIIAMARGLHLEVLAEGVETREQWTFLRERGCQAFQGHLFCVPLPAAQVASRVARCVATPR